jgi:hypothetical protein
MLVQPLGAWVQESVTVNADQVGTAITAIERRLVGQTPVHLVRLAYGGPA